MKTKDQQFFCKMRINSHSLSSVSITKKQQMFTHVHTRIHNHATQACSFDRHLLKQVSCIRKWLGFNT